MTVLHEQLRAAEILRDHAAQELAAAVADGTLTGRSWLVEDFRECRARYDELRASYRDASVALAASVMSR